MNAETLFRDRKEAGAKLAHALESYRGKDALVLGIPRGGVPVAAEVARYLGAELDVVVARKLGAPSQPELALGAITPDGTVFLNREMVRYLSVTQEYLQRVMQEEATEARRRQLLFRGERPAPRIQGRTVIVVDDGLATGATMRAAVRSLRKLGPATLLVAVPVGSAEACEDLAEDVDEVVCLSMPEPFGAIGRFYQNFRQTESAEVRSLLSEFPKKTPQRT